MTRQEVLQYLWNRWKTLNDEILCDNCWKEAIEIYKKKLVCAQCKPLFVKKLS